MMPVVQRGRLGNRSSVQFDWQGDALHRKVADNLLSDMNSLAALIEGRLRATLHRWTGEMADRAFAEVDTEGPRIIIRAGSDAPHTFYHEVRYHPQLRQELDTSIPQLARVIVAALRRA